MNDDIDFMYTMQSTVFYETPERRRPSTEYLDVVTTILNQEYKIDVGGIWTSAAPSNAPMPAHGWKIHISVDIDQDVSAIKAVVPVLKTYSVAFKFYSDRSIFTLSSGKLWPRTQVGKFIVVYPSKDLLKPLLDELYIACADFGGPRVLTDMNYMDSRSVYYRYGGFSQKTRVDPMGRQVTGFELEDGTWIVDARTPYNFNPLNLELTFDPKHSHPSAPPDALSSVLLNGRYKITKAAKFTGTGGVYFGVDQFSGMDIVVRELRHSTGLVAKKPDAGHTPFGFAMQREADILRILDGCGYTPRFVDLFEKDKHIFLAEERYMDVKTLWGYAMDFYFFDTKLPSEAYLKICDIITKLARGLESVHSRGIVLRDLTRTNVLVTQSLDIRFIDFESAYDLNNSEPWITAWTPGYASRNQKSDLKPTISDDDYAFGVLLLDLFTFSSSGFDLNRDGLLARLEMNLADLGLPHSFAEIIRGLTDPDMSNRWGVDRVLRRLEHTVCPTDEIPLFPTLAREKAQVSLGDLACSLEEIDTFFDKCLSPNRDDRLWPASPGVWKTNPISLSDGAVGCAFYLLQRRGAVDEQVIKWIERHATVRSCPAGLFSGLSGVAWLLLKCGRRDGALRIASIAADSVTPDYPHGVVNGLAGIGLTQLFLHISTGDVSCLNRAFEIADRLQERARNTVRGPCWTVDSMTPIGYANGQSGVGLFFIYLGAATGRKDLIAFGADAIDFDVSYKVTSAGRVMWHPFAESTQSDPITPWLHSGTAGVGLATLRAWVATGDEKYLIMARDCALSVCDRLSNKIWQLEGISGAGELLIDVAQLAPEVIERPVFAACHIAHGILPFGIRSERYPNGLAFGGIGHYRVCADYSYGTAGIGIFIDRLVQDRARLFMLDGVLRDNVGVALPCAETA